MFYLITALLLSSILLVYVLGSASSPPEERSAAVIARINTMNDFLPMLLLNLAVGFEVIGIEARGGATKLRLRKTL